MQTMQSSTVITLVVTVVIVVVFFMKVTQNSVFQTWFYSDFFSSTADVETAKLNLAC